MRGFILLLFMLAHCAAQEIAPTPSPALPLNREQPTFSPDLDMVQGVVTQLTPETTQASTPALPPNRKQPTFNPGLDMVQGALTQLAPGETPVFKPKPSRPIPPNRKQSVISKADVVMAETDKIGILVNNLAQNLALDLTNLLNNLPVTPIPKRGGTRAVENRGEEDWADEWEDP